MGRRIALIVVAVGVTLALGLGGSGYLGKVGEAQAQEQENGAQTLPPKEDKPHKPGHYKKHCREPQTYEEADLCQQWRVAESTEKIRALTAAQNALSQWEVGFLAGTLLATAIAAIAAAWAAMAASKSVAVTREIGEAQTRAYLALTGAECLLTEDGVALRFDISNSGQSPALQVHVDVMLKLKVTNKDGIDSPRFQIAKIPIRDIPSGDTAKSIWSRAGEPDTGLIGIINDGGECWVFIDGAIIFDDVFERHWPVPFERADNLRADKHQGIFDVDLHTLNRTKKLMGLMDTKGS